MKEMAALQGPPVIVTVVLWNKHPRTHTHTHTEVEKEA